MESESLDYSHLYNDYYKNKVYLPSEDTFFFVDVLHNDFKNIIQKNPKLILELGSGSGYVSTFLLRLFMLSQNKDENYYNYDMPFCVCVDINKFANHSTNHMLRYAKMDVYSESICMDMFNNLANIKFDLIVFNPPYVPGTLEDVNNVIDMAWNGGANGSEIIKKFIQELGGYLSDDGSAFLLIEQRNNVDEILEFIRIKQFSVKILDNRKVLGETLTVLKIIKPK